MSTVETSPTLGAPMMDRRCHDKTCARKGAYRMAGYCYNCKTEPIVGLFTAGHETDTYGPCPVCGCHYRIGWRGLEDAQPAALPVSAGPSL